MGFLEYRFTVNFNSIFTSINLLISKLNLFSNQYSILGESFMNDRLFAVRGATTVTEDTKEAITKAVLEMYDLIVERNKLNSGNIVSIQFTITPDLRSMNPATALRTQKKSFMIPLFCMQEPVVENMLGKTIRTIIYFYSDSEHKVEHVYLGKAAALRQDLTQK